MKNKKILFATFIIVIVFLFLRLYRLPERIIFDWDQEQFTTQARDIILLHKFTLLGPRVTDDTGFFLAPYFTYLFVPFLYLSGTHPVALIPFIIIITFLFLSTSIFTLEKMFGYKTALYFVLIWAINPFLIFFDVVPWWPVLIPTGVMLTWLLLFLIYHRNRPAYLILLGVTLGLFMNMHFQFVFISFFALIMLFFFYRQKKITTVNIVLVIAVSALMFLPLILFDLRHDFLNTKLFLNYFTHRVGANQDPKPFAWIPVLTNTFDSMTIVNNSAIAIIFYCAFILSQWYISKKSKGFLHHFFSASCALSIITVIGFSFYGRRPSEYYFIFLYPSIIITLINILSVRHQDGYVVLYVLIAAFLIFPRIQKAMEPNLYGLHYKDRLIHEISLYKKTPLKIDFQLPLGAYTGYDYLLEYYDIHQSEATSAAQIVVRDPARRTDQHMGGLGLTIPKKLSKD